MKFIAVVIPLLLLSNAVHAENEHYPAFDWGTVPVYAHLGKSSGDLTDNENQFLASRYGFITLEKGHAIEQRGSSEAGILNGSRALKAFNPEMKVLFYWNALLDYPMYRAHDEFQILSDGAVRLPSGELDLKNGRLKKYDLSNPDVRRWWVRVAQEAVESDALDGIFVDALPQISGRPATMVDLWGEERFRAMEAGTLALLKELREAIGHDKLVIYNGLRTIPGGWADGGLRYLEYTDGVIIEHFAHFNNDTKERIAADMELMMNAAEQGKIVILKGWPGFNFTQQAKLEQSASELREEAALALEFSLACFLIIASENSYFNYTWGYRHAHGALDWYPELDQRLGPPLGESVRSGWSYRREFEFATVEVDIETRVANIEWRE